MFFYFLIQRLLNDPIVQFINIHEPQPTFSAKFHFHRSVAGCDDSSIALLGWLAQNWLGWVEFVGFVVVHGPQSNTIFSQVNLSSVAYP